MSVFEGWREPFYIHPTSLYSHADGNAQTRSIKVPLYLEYCSESMHPMRHYKNVPHYVTIIQLRKSPPPLRPTMSFRATLPRRTVVAQIRSAGSSILLGPPEYQPPMLSHITGILYKRKTFTTTMKRIHRQHTLVFTHEHNLVQSNVSPKEDFVLAIRRRLLRA